jgi:hypothetical protein
VQRIHLKRSAWLATSRWMGKSSSHLIQLECNAYYYHSCVWNISFIDVYIHPTIHSVVNHTRQGLLAIANKRFNQLVCTCLARQQLMTTVEVVESRHHGDKKKSKHTMSSIFMI